MFWERAFGYEETIITKSVDLNCLVHREEGYFLSFRFKIALYGKWGYGSK